MKQTQLGLDPPGDCFRCCISKLLDDDSGPWWEKEEDWDDYILELWAWLKERGLVYIELNDLGHAKDTLEDVPCIIVGRSTRGVDHAYIGTVKDGVLFDPHPSNEGLVPGNWVYGFFVRILKYEDVGYDLDH